MMTHNWSGPLDMANWGNHPESRTLGAPALRTSTAHWDREEGGQLLPGSQLYPGPHTPLGTALNITNSKSDFGQQYLFSYMTAHHCSI